MLGTCTLTASKMKEIEYRTKNNESCRRSRINRKIEMSQVRMKEIKLQSMNDALTSQLNELEESIQNLRKSILFLVGVKKIKQEKS